MYDRYCSHKRNTHKAVSIFSQMKQPPPPFHPPSIASPIQGGKQPVDGIEKRSTSYPDEEEFIAESY